MAFRLFKSKDKEPAPASPAPAEPTPAAPAEKPPALPSSPNPSNSGPQKIVPRQGSIAAALKAATSSHSSSATPSQSAIFRPKVSVVIKPEGNAPSAPVPSAGSSVPATAGAGATPSVAPAIPSTIDIPMADFLQLFPEQALVPGAAGQAGLPQTVSLPTTEIVPQLSKGRVLLPLPSLVQICPKEILESSFSATEEMKVKIPLQWILPRLPDSAMALPENQARQEMDANMGSPFSEKKGGTSASAPPPSMHAPRLSGAAPRAPSKIMGPIDSSESGTTQIRPPSQLQPRPSRLDPKEATRALTQSITMPLKPGVAAGPKLSGVKPVVPPSPAPGASAPFIPPPTIPPPISKIKPAVPSPAPAAAVAPASPPSSSEAPGKPGDLAALLGVKEGELKIQDLAQKIRGKWNLLGVLIATSDGLPLVAQLPEGQDANAWSSLGSRLFGKWNGDETAGLSGIPGKIMLNLGSGSTWMTACHANGIYLYLLHPLETVTADFDRQTGELAVALSQFCDQKPAS